MNLEQSRAGNAFAQVQKIRDPSQAKDFLNLARQFPAMLQTNGLLASWAFLLAKGKGQGEHWAVLQALLGHLKCCGQVGEREHPHQFEEL